MKKKVIRMMVVSMVLWGCPTFASASDVKTPETTNANANRSIILIDRLEKINETDKSSMSRLEKKALRKEVKSIDRELRTMDGGVYMSVGAIIIVLLLIIILL